MAETKPNTPPPPAANTHGPQSVDVTNAGIGPRPVGQPPATAPTAKQPPAPTGPHYDDKGTLTRAGMEHVHNSGGSVLYKGRLYPPGSALPAESELAAGNADELRRLQGQNDDRIRALQAENDRLKANIKEVGDAKK